ncbi:twin-arginine translocation signal domain-containing protein [Haloarcula sp. JP-L23]|uniref:twin-arginine translocation signal domain-containing protein n=1 Tax=Haloarcula sp. JP-L23 TaxID=2716717 RepID=UPI00140EF596|nr:twin-arginine translocation signal domain-containing protein [Haloarcula sp. JP-L23]
MGQYPTDSSRRDVMKALGAGAVLSGLGGTATAQADDGRQGGGERETDGRGTVPRSQSRTRGCRPSRRRLPRICPSHGPGRSASLA